MILSEKILAMRKKMGWSQEELAEQLDVSRQSVSKWEVGAAIPDLDKILKMSELFGVSTDYLLKDDQEEAEFLREVEKTEERVVSAEEANAYMGEVQAASGKIAIAVSLFILSPVCLILLGGLAELGRLSEDMAGGIGLAILMIPVAIGVAICVYYGMRLEKYAFLEKMPFALQYGVSGIVEKRKEQFEEKFRLNTVVGVLCCVVGVIPLLVGGAFSSGDFVLICCTCGLLMFVAVGVNCFVRVGMVQDSFEKLLQQKDYTVKHKAVNKRTSWFPRAYWLTVTAGYLGVSFYNNRWDRTWIVWPVAGVLFAAIYGTMNAIFKDRDDL